MGRVLVIAGALFTLAYSVVVALYLRGVDVGAMKPQDLGSFLGGVVGPLAFFWLVLGFFQQGIELRHSVQALNLQSEELKNSVEQQKALVDLTREQFEHERELRAAAEREAEYLSVPRIGVQNCGYLKHGPAYQFTFLLANAGATCTSVKFQEGERSHGEAVTWAAGEGHQVVFQFPDNASVQERHVEVTYLDARGRPGRNEFTFPVIVAGAERLLTSPPNDHDRLEESNGEKA